MRHPGTLWAINDSGETSLRVFALDEHARLRATYSLPDLVPIDVEDVALWHRPTAPRDVLLLADIGDNLARDGGSGRPYVSVYGIDEPDPRATTPPTLAFSMRLTYPDRAHDAEAMFVDPTTGLLYLFAKETLGHANFYRLRPPFGDGTHMLELAGTLHVGAETFPGLMITAAAIRSDGGMIAFRTYGSLLAFDRAPGTSVEAALASTVHVLPLPGERQGEALTFAADGGGLYSVSEGAGASLHYTSVHCVAIAGDHGR